MIRVCAPGAILSLAFTLMVPLISTPTAHAAPGDIYVGEDNGTIERFSPDGTESTFATGLGSVCGLAFDSSGNLFAASYGTGNLYKFSPDGTQSLFATGVEAVPGGLAVNSRGELFAVANTANKLGIIEFSPDGSSTTLDSGFSAVSGLTVDRADNLYAVAQPTIASYLYRYTSTGIKSTFASQVYSGPLASDSSDNIYAAHSGNILKFSPGGARSTFFSSGLVLQAMACDANDNLFVAEATDYQILKLAPDGTQTVFFSGLTSLPTAMAIQVPEPGPGALFALGGMLIAFVRRREGRR